MTVEALIRILLTLPKNATVHAYEGEDTGIVIRDGEDFFKQLAFIETRQGKEPSQ